MAKVVQKKIKGADSRKPKTGLKSHAKLQKKTGSQNTKKSNQKKSSKLDDEIRNLKKMIVKIKADLKKTPEKPIENSENKNMSKNVKCLKEEYKKMRTAAHDRAEKIAKLESDDKKYAEVIFRKQNDINSYATRNKAYEKSMREWEIEKKKLEKKCEEKHQNFLQEINDTKRYIYRQTIEWKELLRRTDYFKRKLGRQELPIKSLTELKIFIEKEIEDIHIKRSCDNADHTLKEKIDAELSLAVEKAGGFKCNCW